MTTTAESGTTGTVPRGPQRLTHQFPTIGGCWIPVAFSKTLGARDPLGLVVDGVPVVLWRQGEKVAALVDQCPHRSVKLSVGKVTSDGCIQCPFHAWEYDETGVCRSIPLLGDRGKPEKVSSQRLAACDLGGMIWLFTRVLEAADESPPDMPDLPDSMTESGWSGAPIVREWDAHWSRAIQTMLDVAHIPVVHSRTIGAGLGRKIGKLSDATLSLETNIRSDGSFDMDWSLTNPADGRSSDSGRISFLPPNGMSLRVPLKGVARFKGRRVPRAWYLHIWCTPTANGHSNQFIVPKRNFGKRNPFWRLADALNIVVLNEDKRNVETADPSRVPQPSDEISMPTDASTIAFQRYHWRTFCEGKP
ncbi:MAG: Rieske 2Fe-2S domain-containing protein [Planctomycetota bacterium]